MKDHYQSHEIQNTRKIKINTLDIYSEAAVWLCENRKTRFKTRIHGALAQILKKYPGDYKLRLLSIQEKRHEQSTTIDQ